MTVPRTPTSNFTTPPAGAAAPVRHPDAPTAGTALGSHYSHCFGCGPQHGSGLRMDIRAGEGVDVHAEFTVKDNHQGGPGLAHGGLLTTAMDETLGSLGWMLHIASVTGRLETDFLQPVPVDAVLHIHARATGVHGRKIYCEAEGRIGGADGPVAIRASALFVQVKLEHFTTHGRPADIKAAKDDPDLLKRARALEVNP
ncbi:PaaI family thioesterase [Kitasatospora viridis]|uniref:Acyl-coenzyme A thioesterase THEM4 n=1 Tax=Kitasatospora viridis TaxID=281105 RepID=A0A561UDV1_9ACTN|nr:PaaI family thioesterase [Kitasatospora viridis]TWF97553.1 acyl-coenzyme A thioesterase PaaI-like protein [Kitasatospora viridis]